MHCSTRKGLATLILAALLLPVLGGCGKPKSKIQNYNVQITLGDSLYNESVGRWKTVKVDIVAVNDNDLADWTSVEPADYFSAEDHELRRIGSPWRHTFSDNEAPRNPAPTVTLSSSDSHWNDTYWDKAENFIILTYFTGFTGTADDARRKVLPRDRLIWKTNLIEVKINNRGIDVLTEQHAVDP